MDIDLGYYLFPQIPKASKDLVDLYASIDDSRWPYNGNKSFMRIQQELNREKLPKPFIDLADFTSERAAAYLQSEVIGFHSARATRTEPMGLEWKASQLYHRDWEDDRNVKVFVLLRDVEKKHGPFTFINAEESQKITNAMGYVNNRSHRKTDEEVYNIYAGAPILFTGKAGSTIMVDTCRCFHYGGRTLEDSRLMALIQLLKPGHRGKYPSEIKIYR